MALGELEDKKQRDKKLAAIEALEKAKRDMMSAKTRMFFQKRKKQDQPERPICLISPFVADPLVSRLNLMETLALMSDYRSAYHMAHDLYTDIKNADKSKLLFIEKKDTVRLISICLYIMDKLKMYQSMMDLYESFMCNQDIMTCCNPFSLYYLLEFAKLNPKLKNLHRYVSGHMGELAEKFVKMRL